MQRPLKPEGAASFTGDVLAPLNWTGDQQHPELKDGDVTTTPGFKEAYAQYAEAGWMSLPMRADIGGMGLPQALAAATAEMTYAANMAFGLCPMLTSSAVKAIDALKGGSQWRRQLCGLWTEDLHHLGRS